MDVVGPVCETGDFLGQQRSLAVAAGDLLAVKSAGAYGFAMSSNYNSRPRPPEVLIAGDQSYLIRARETHGRCLARRNASAERITMLIQFSKMHGLGNDFVVIDNVTQNGVFKS